MTTTEQPSPDRDHPPTSTITDTGASPGSDDAPENGSETEGSDEQPGREAAKYRRQLRAAEGERDTARQQLAAVRRQTAEDASGLLKPAGLWAAGVDVDTLYGDDGRLDRERLREAVTGASETLGLAPKPRAPRPDPVAGFHQRTARRHLVRRPAPPLTR